MWSVVDTSLQRGNIIWFIRPLPVGFIDEGGSLSYFEIFSFYLRSVIDSGQGSKLISKTYPSFSSINLTFLIEKRSSNTDLFLLFFYNASVKAIFLLCIFRRVFGDIITVDDNVFSIILLPDSWCDFTYSVYTHSLSFSFFSYFMEKEAINFIKCLSCPEKALVIHFSDLFPSKY